MPPGLISYTKKMTERDSSKIWVGQSGDCGNSPQRKPTNSNIPRKKLCRTES